MTSTLTLEIIVMRIFLNEDFHFDQISLNIL